MQKYNHIKALFFLAIFTLLLLHPLVPHWHHQPEIKHLNGAVSHGDSHHHHHDAPNKENSKKGFLELLLEMHLHSVVSDEILLTHQSGGKQLVIKKDISKPVSHDHTNISINYDHVKKIKVYHPPNNYFNQFQSCLDSRGPPYLV